MMVSQGKMRIRDVIAIRGANIKICLGRCSFKCKKNMLRQNINFRHSFRIDIKKEASRFKLI